MKKLRRQTPCETCPKPEIEEGNVEIWQVFQLIASQPRTAGMGGFISFDYNALPFVLRALSIPESEWIFVLKKLSIIQEVALKYWNDKSAKT